LINGILAAEELLAARLAHAVKTYPRHITAAIGALLLCAGGGAFAVASLGPTASDVPVQRILESVPTLPIAAQAEALDSFNFTLFRSEVTRASDTAEALLKRLGISDQAAATFLRSNAQVRNGILSRAGRTIRAEATQESKLQRLSARWIPDGNGGFQSLTVERQGSGFVVRAEADALTPASRLASGVVRSSFFAATDVAGIPDAVASQMADVFGDGIDFNALRKGDRFAVVYETFEADGQMVRTGRVLSAEVETAGRISQVLWFQEPGRKGAYYRPNGESLRRSYLASPVEFSRISSGFEMRTHPIFNTWRQHHGVDFAAPTGTPVRSVGDGVVDFAGQQSGYGNIVIIKHANNQSTVYAHLSRMDVKLGQPVTQSQTIGAVGSTGWATGPHLHFEFRVNGEYEDPALIARQDSATPINPAFRPAFDRMAAAARAELDAAATVMQARAE